MNPSSLSNVRSQRPALDLISLATMSPELARKSIRELLLANPGYFGKITDSSFKAVLRIQQDTTFESVGHVGYSPTLEHLQATINLNQNTGYSLTDSVSKEYVRFYLSFDGGLTWIDQGLNSIVVRNEFHSIPRQQTLSVPISSALTLCFLDCLPYSRTILSWNTPPPEDVPDWIPMWGDVVNSQLRIEMTKEHLPDSRLNGFVEPETGCSSIWPSS